MNRRSSLRPASGAGRRRWAAWPAAWLVPVLWLGLLFGLFAPAGYMPALGPAGLSITICSGAGGTAAVVPRADPLFEQLSVLNAARGDAGDRHRPGDEGLTAPHCAFVGAGLSGTLDDPPALAAAVGPAALPPLAALSTGRPNRHRATTPPATGPPAAA